MNLLKPSKLGITSCIPSPHGRLQTIGDGNENSPMRGVLAVAQQGWENEIQQTQVDELMVVSNIFDHQARIHSYELLAQFKEVNTNQLQSLFA